MAHNSIKNINDYVSSSIIDYLERCNREKMFLMAELNIKNVYPCATDGCDEFSINRAKKCSGKGCEKHWCRKCTYKYRCGGCDLKWCGGCYKQSDNFECFFCNSGCCKECNKKCMYCDIKICTHCAKTQLRALLFDEKQNLLCNYCYYKQASICINCGECEYDGKVEIVDKTKQRCNKTECPRHNIHDWFEVKCPDDVPGLPKSELDERYNKLK